MEKYRKREVGGGEGGEFEVEGVKGNGRTFGEVWINQLMQVFFLFFLFFFVFLCFWSCLFLFLFGFLPFYFSVYVNHPPPH